MFFSFHASISIEVKEKNREFINKPKKGEKKQKYKYSCFGTRNHRMMSRKRETRAVDRLKKHSVSRCDQALDDQAFDFQQAMVKKTIFSVFSDTFKT